MSKADRLRSRRLAIFERDSWICRICFEPVDPTLKHPHIMSATIDHVIPSSRGGSGGPVQLAHYACNSRKRDRLPEDMPPPPVALYYGPPTEVELEALAIAVEVTRLQTAVREQYPRRLEALTVLRSHGWSLQKIADALGVSKTAIANILNPPKGKS